MNMKKIAVASTLTVLAVVAILVAYPAMAASPTPRTTSIQQAPQHPHYIEVKEIQLSVGQTLTLNSVAGGYWVAGDRAVNGTASESMTLQVTAAFKGGYALSLTGGSLIINDTTYDISGGTAEVGPYGTHMVGQGQSGTAQFLFEWSSLGKFGGTTYATLRVDLTSGSSEFVARLLVTVSV
jgi:hypothetical protein